MTVRKTTDLETILGASRAREQLILADLPCPVADALGTGLKRIWSSNLGQFLWILQLNLKEMNSETKGIPFHTWCRPCQWQVLRQ